MESNKFTQFIWIILIIVVLSCSETKKCKLILERLDKNKPRNVIFILSDDHRYDFMGFTGKVPWLETPGMDQLAENGIYFENAFVSTALSSPSRASRRIRATR